MQAGLHDDDRRCCTSLSAQSSNRASHVILLPAWYRARAALHVPQRHHRRALIVSSKRSMHHWPDRGLRRGRLAVGASSVDRPPGITIACRVARGIPVLSLVGRDGLWCGVNVRCETVTTITFWRS
eukprot:5620299-Prymnesium_polylepis.1